MGRYLVTGCAGFIGSNVALQLIGDGHQVIGIDNLNDAYDTRIKDWRLKQLLPMPGFSFQETDITSLPALRPLFANGFDGVVNLAARAGVPQSTENPWIYIETNVTGTLNLLELCHQCSVGKFVLASSSSLYGAKNPQPFREDANTDSPLSPYAASKKAAEVLCYTYHSLYGVDATVLRYFTVYGPAGRPDMALFRFVQRIIEGRTITVTGTGIQARDFTYVEDIARGTIMALKPLGYEIINLGSDQPVVLMDAIRQIEELTGKRAQILYRPLHPTDMPSTWADITKAERMLGWRPRYTLRAGLERLVEWYNANSKWAQDIKTD